MYKCTHFFFAHLMLIFCYILFTVFSIFVKFISMNLGKTVYHTKSRKRCNFTRFPSPVICPSVCIRCMRWRRSRRRRCRRGRRASPPPPPPTTTPPASSSQHLKQNGPQSMNRHAAPRPERHRSNTTMLCRKINQPNR